MGFLSWLGINKPRDAPMLPDIQDNVRDSGNLFVFGMTHSGERVDERTAMQIVTVYACVRLLSNTIAGLPLHLYRYTGAGEDKERATDHPLYKILYRQPNPEMSSFSFWEALMCHLLLWGNAYAQIVRDGKNGIVGLYPLLPENVEIDRDPKSGAFFTGDGDKKPLGILDETGGAELGVTAASQTAITFDEVFDLYYSLKSPYRRNAQFVCNETILLQLMKLKDKNDNYLWKPSLDIAKPDTLLGRPIRTSSFMPGIARGERVLLFGDMKNYWVADRQNRTFRRLNELYARTDQVGFLTTQRVDGRLILPESVKVLKMAGTKAATGGTTGGNTGGNG